MKLTLGDINKIAQSDIPALSEIKKVQRSANRVIRRINSIFPGTIDTELAFVRKRANLTESLTFASADPDTIVTTTDISSSISPGFVAYILGTANNDGFYYVASVSTVTITLVGDSKLIAETVSATIAIFDVKAQEILPPTNASLTHAAASPDTITDSGVNDFENLGVALNDIAILTGSSNNDGAYSIASSKGFEITLQANESLNAVGPEAGRIRIIRPSIAYQFDAENNELTVPSDVKEIIKVFENNVELDPRSFEFVNDSNNSTELVYNIRERSKIRFPSGIGDTAADELHVKVNKDVPEFLNAASAAFIEIPTSMKETIIAGTLSYLLATPEFKDQDLFALNKDAYASGLSAISELEKERSPSAKHERDYDYFPPTS